MKVYTNDPGNHVAVLRLNMEVRDSMHMTDFPAEEIFSGKCKGCHVDRGKGKTGIGLFVQDCVMCHGKSASSLQKMRSKSREEIARAIREGIENTSMPGWAVENGGPLNDKEIGSLIKVIKP